MSATFVDLSAQDCHDRLSAGGVGRIAFCGPDGPELYPVNFEMVDGDIVFRTAPYTRLGRTVHGAAVVFEVDAVDHRERTGWSVVVRGVATRVDDPDDVVALRRRAPAPWAGGHRPLVVRIRPRTTSGRRVTPGW